jgi:DNA-binding CsgD family transcriptional regulator
VQRFMENDYWILKYLAEGDSSKEIARKLRRSRHTINNRVRKLYAMLGTRSRAELVARAFQNGTLERSQMLVAGPPTGSAEKARYVTEFDLATEVARPDCFPP